MMMMRNVLVLAMAMGLTGCYQAADQARRDDATQNQAALTGTQATWVSVMNASQKTRQQLAGDDYTGARSTLQALYRDLYSVVTAEDLTPEIRTRVTRVFPTLVTLQSKVEARDADAKVLVDRLGDMLADTQSYMVGAGWMRNGGGAGMAPEEQPMKEKESR